MTANLQVKPKLQRVSLSTMVVPNPAVQPFIVTPSTAVVNNSGSARSAVAQSSANAILHGRYLLGAQLVIAPES